MEWTCGCGAVNQEAETSCNRCGAPMPAREAAPVRATAGPPGSPRPGRSSSAGKILLIVFVLAVVGLLAVCIIGVAAAIAVPAVLKGRESAREKQKQAQAMAQMREFAADMREYGRTHGHYPNWENRESGFHLYDMEEARAFMFKERNQGVTIDWGPTLRDPWENSYQYGVNGASDEFVIICKGSDGQTTAQGVSDEHVGTHCFEDDIIWLNDGFVQEPEGSQKKCS
jgi:type II secretory pathway pseudopilin PulG